MKVRDVYLASGKTETDSGTDQWPLNTLGKIQWISLVFKATNGATSNTVAKLKSLISKIEVVDGSLVIASLSGRELFAANCFCNGIAPFQDLTAGAGVVLTDELILMFGRYLGDADYYLDTSQFKNPILRITWAFAVSATVGIATGTSAFSVLARTIEDGAHPYKGFIMRKEVFSFTSAASGDQPIILPLDYPYMGLYVAALKTTIEPDTIITNFKLTRNTDQYVDFSMVGRDLYAQNLQAYGEFEQKMRPLVDTAATWLGDMYFKTGAFFTKPGATGKSITTAVAAESVTTFATTGATADLTELALRGGAPGAAAYMPFHAMNPYDTPDPADFLNPAGLGELKLLLTQAVSGAACTVTVEQLHP